MIYFEENVMVSNTNCTCYDRYIVSVSHISVDKKILLSKYTHFTVYKIKLR